LEDQILVIQITAPCTIMAELAYNIDDAVPAMSDGPNPSTDMEDGRIPEPAEEKGPPPLSGSALEPSLISTTTTSGAQPIIPAETRNTLPNVLLRMPNTAFGIAMGLAGNSIMWKSAGKAAFVSTRIDTDAPNAIFWFAGATVLVIVAVAYVYKMVFSFPLCVAEWNCPTRIHFMNAPNLALIMLVISLPWDCSNEKLRILWTLSLIVQTGMTQYIYAGWLFSDASNISQARPQFLLSTVGWFLLSVLGIQAQVKEQWGLGLPAFCFGIGSFFYIMVVISLFQGVHADAQKVKGSPAFALLIAPPATAIIALDALDGDPATFNVAAEMLLGWCLILFLLLLKIGPTITKNPPSLGAYWAYIFPTSALAGATIRYATVLNTRQSEGLAAFFMGFATLAACIVLARMSLHMYLVLTTNEQWGDPLLNKPLQGTPAPRY
jgi:tellurite resistance protein TehA-like permease